MQSVGRFRPIGFLGSANRRVKLNDSPSVATCQKRTALTGRRRSYAQLDADAFFPMASVGLLRQRAAKPRPATPSSIIAQVDGSGKPTGPPKSKASTETTSNGRLSVFETPLASTYRPVPSKIWVTA